MKTLKIYFALIALTLLTNNVSAQEKEEISPREKMELETLFSRYDNVKFYEADYKKYGFGATEVYIMQNPKTS